MTDPRILNDRHTRAEKWRGFIFVARRKARVHARGDECPAVIQKKGNDLMDLFAEILDETDQINRKQQFDKTVAHLPSTMDEGLPFFRNLLERHHRAMMEGQYESVMALREEAKLLAKKLNNGEPGILAHDNAPGCFLANQTKAPNGTVPLWGQEGRFEIEASGTLIEIELEGIFGIGSGAMYWLVFSAHSVCKKSPFISETGYRSFLGIQANIGPGLTPDIFVQKVIEAYITDELRGCLVAQSSILGKEEAA